MLFNDSNSEICWTVFLNRNEKILSLCKIAIFLQYENESYIYGIHLLNMQQIKHIVGFELRSPSSIFLERRKTTKFILESSSQNEKYKYKMNGYSNI